jgi:hypothetical protein
MTSRELETGRLLRRDFLASLGIAIAGASVLPAAAAAALRTQSPGAGGVPLFNGKDLSGLYTYSNSHGRNNDPEHVFSVHDGMLHLTGEVTSAIMTEQEYANYRLVVEYKWGTKTWPPREAGAMDCGLLLHCGTEDAVAVGTWPQCIQCQIYQGSVGDLVLLPGKDMLSATIEGETRGGAFHHMPGAPAQVREAGGKKLFDSTAHFGKDPEWKNVKGFFNKTGAERPHGEWNTVEVVADADTLTYIVNGRTVNKATNLRVTKAGEQLGLTSGRIGIQCEGSEIFFRRLELLPLR